MRILVAMGLTTLVCVSTHAQIPTYPPIYDPPPSEWVHIDGSKNPEMIPQWSAWATTFDIIAGGTRQIPTLILKHLSETEAGVVLQAADEDAKNAADCKKRILDMFPLLFTSTPKVINEKTRELQLECRLRTLDIRDRLLPRLSEAARSALIQFVESTKAGTKVSVPKRELAHFLKPQ